VTLKLKRTDFIQFSKAISLGEPTNSTNSIYEWGLKLLVNFDMSSKFRLIGIGVSKLVPATKMPDQLNLFEKADHRGKSWKEVERAMDAIKKRFGREAIKRGGI